MTLVTVTDSSAKAHYHYINYKGTVNDSLLTYIVTSLENILH